MTRKDSALLFGTNTPDLRGSEEREHNSQTSKEVAWNTAEFLREDDWSDAQIEALAVDLERIRDADWRLRESIGTKGASRPRTKRLQREQRELLEAADAYEAAVQMLRKEERQAARHLAAFWETIVPEAFPRGGDDWTDPFELVMDLSALARADKALSVRLSTQLRSGKPRPPEFNAEQLKQDRAEADRRALVYAVAARPIHNAPTQASVLLMGVRGNVVGPGPLNPPRSQEGVFGLVEDLVTLARESREGAAEITKALASRKRSADDLLVERVWRVLVRHGLDPTAHVENVSEMATGTLVVACGMLRRETPTMIAKAFWVTKARDLLSSKQRDPLQRDSRLTDDTLLRELCAWLESQGGSWEGAPHELLVLLNTFIATRPNTPHLHPIWPASPFALEKALRRIGLEQRRMGGRIGTAKGAGGWRIVLRQFDAATLSKEGPPAPSPGSGCQPGEGPGEVRGEFR